MVDTGEIWRATEKRKLLNWLRKQREIRTDNEIVDGLMSQLTYELNDTESTETTEQGGKEK